MNCLTQGAVAGLFATIPMTLAMKAMHSQLPELEQYPLPPRLIVENVADKAGVEEQLGENDEVALTFAAHFGYGAAAGAVYGAALDLVEIEPSAASGVAYGLGVWTLSYLGLLPAMDLLSPATEHPARRNALMIAAHVVWGAALGSSARRLGQ